jgi:hypothetical protein
VKPLAMGVPGRSGGLIDLVRVGLLEAPWAYRESFRISGSAGPDADRERSSGNALTRLSWTPDIVGREKFRCLFPS